MRALPRPHLLPVPDTAAMLPIKSQVLPRASTPDFGPGFQPKRSSLEKLQHGNGKSFAFLLGTIDRDNQKQRTTLASLWKKAEGNASVAERQDLIVEARSIGVHAFENAASIRKESALPTRLTREQRDEIKARLFGAESVYRRAYALRAVFGDSTEREAAIADFVTDIKAQNGALRGGWTFEAMQLMFVRLNAAFVGSSVPGKVSISPVGYAALDLVTEKIADFARQNGGKALLGRLGEFYCHAPEFLYSIKDSSVEQIPERRALREQLFATGRALIALAAQK